MKKKTRYSADDVTIVDVPATKVAVMAHRGVRPGNGETIQRFIAWPRRPASAPHERRPSNLLLRSARNGAGRLSSGLGALRRDRVVAPDNHGVTSGPDPAGRCRGCGCWIQ